MGLLSRIYQLLRSQYNTRSQGTNSYNSGYDANYDSYDHANDSDAGGSDRGDYRNIYADETAASRKDSSRNWEKDYESFGSEDPDEAQQRRSQRYHYETSTQHGQDGELMHYYAALEIPYGSDLATVRQAYRRLMKRYHPDRHRHDIHKARIATEIVQELHHAYHELCKRLA